MQLNPGVRGAAPRGSAEWAHCTRRGHLRGPRWSHRERSFSPLTQANEAFQDVTAIQTTLVGIIPRSVIALCLVATSACAPQPSPHDRFDTASLWIELYRKALDLGLRTAHASEEPVLVCVAGVDGRILASVVDALAESTTLLVRPNSACRQEPLFSAPRGRSLVVDTLTGRRGIQIRADGLNVDSTGGFTMRLSYYEHGLSSAFWRCRGQRTATKWEVTECTMTSIS